MGAQESVRGGCVWQLPSLPPPIQNDIPKQKYIIGSVSRKYYGATKFATIIFSTSTMPYFFEDTSALGKSSKDFNAGGSAAHNKYEKRSRIFHVSESSSVTMICNPPFNSPSSGFPCATQNMSVKTEDEYAKRALST
jgi:hypothetical protein